MPPDKSKRWAIERRVTLAVVLTLLMQAAGALIWATELDARVGIVEREQVSTSGLTERFIRLEERLDFLKRDTETIKRQLEFLNERTTKK
jgi:hypothetical protein